MPQHTRTFTSVISAIYSVKKLRSHLILGLLFTGTCSSIICGAACDWIEPGECLGPGQLFGPCDPNLPTGCHADLACHKVEKGDICLPGVIAADDFSAATCAAWRGTMACSIENDRCFLTCDGPDACEGGTLCDEIAGMCVYPRNLDPAPEGEMFGPCLDGGACLYNHTCVVRTVGGLNGSICLPACDACAKPDVVEACSLVGSQAPTCTSDNLCGIPCSSQDHCDGDAVCMEGMCLRAAF